MSPILIVVVLTVSVFVFSQFGGRFTARTSLIWVGVAAFLLIAVIEPEVFRPIVRLLGIELISNFFLASMVCFLFLQQLELNSLHTATQRRLRSVSSTIASNKFKRKMLVDVNLPKVLVIFPCYNEDENIASLITSIKNLSSNCDMFNLDCCIIDDGSSDKTLEYLTENAHDIHVSHPSNFGVASVLLTGFKIGVNNRYDYVVQCDSDGQHPLTEIPRMVFTAQEKSLDLLIGSRFAKTPEGDHNGYVALESTTYFRRLGSLIISYCINVMWPKIHCTDPTSGFRVYSRRACIALAKDMPDEYPEPESIPILIRQGYRVDEIAVRMYARLKGSSSLTAWKSFRYMVKVISALLGYRLRNLYWRSL
jgi:hypothetical protein